MLCRKTHALIKESKPADILIIDFQPQTVRKLISVVSATGSDILLWKPSQTNILYNFEMMLTSSSLNNLLICFLNSHVYGLEKVQHLSVLSMV